MVEAVGWISFYGLSPAIDFFKYTGIDPCDDDREINILLSDCADLRHIFRSITDQLPLRKSKREHKLNIWIHERNLECIARDLLFLTLICETNYSKRERMELFLDLYANTMIRDKTDAYLQSTTNELIQLVTEDERCQSVIKPIVHFDNLKFKERDELEDVISSYYNVHPFDIERMRDDRLRHFFADRYDVRRNMVDWDYNFEVKNLCPFMHIQEYKDWRLTGLAFEMRLASNTTPNRTMGSYVPGNDVSLLFYSNPA